jgi:hypothetical protein
MASYSVLPALSGFRYSAVEKRVTFQTRWNRESVQCFFATGSASGLYSQKRQAGALSARLKCRHGELLLRRLVFGNDAKLGEAPTATVNGPDGRAILGTAKNQPSGLEIELPGEMIVPEGQSVVAVVHATGGTKKA